MSSRGCSRTQFWHLVYKQTWLTGSTLTEFTNSFKMFYSRICITTIHDVDAKSQQKCCYTWKFGKKIVIRFRSGHLVFLCPSSTLQARRVKPESLKWRHSGRYPQEYSCSIAARARRVDSRVWIELGQTGTNGVSWTRFPRGSKCSCKHYSDWRI